MEQILNKLSEIELTAKRIMEDADSTKSALSAEMEEKCKEFDAALEQETNTKIQELRSSLEQKKTKSFLNCAVTWNLLSVNWTVITARITKPFQSIYSGNFLQTEKEA